MQVRNGGICGAGDKSGGFPGGRSGVRGLYWGMIEIVAVFEDELPTVSTTG
jgi:hypothetical protein